jgi:hypothetical protein
LELGLRAKPVRGLYRRSDSDERAVSRSGGEPWVDVNPANPLNVIAVWQQDRWSTAAPTGSSPACRTTAARPGTETFPHFSTARADGRERRRLRPRVRSVGVVRAGRNRVPGQPLVQRDEQRNASWRAARRTAATLERAGQTVLRDSGDRDSSFAFNDKESVTADATKAGFAYAVWDRFTSPGPYSRTSIEGLINSRAFREPIWFSRTTDGGHTWEPARNIYDRSSQNGTIGSQILVGKNGDLLNFFDEFFVHKNSDDQRGESISVIRSTDQGLTWDKKSTVIAPSWSAAHSIRTPAADPRRGRTARGGDRPGERRALRRLAGRELQRRRRDRVLDVHRQRADLVDADQGQPDAAQLNGGERAGVRRRVHVTPTERSR